MHVNSVVNSDVNRIVEWVSVKKTGRSEPDLPMDFVQSPTLSELKKVREKLNHGNKGAKISNTGDGKTYVNKFYSTNYGQYEKDSETEGGKARLPHLMKKEKKRGNRKFSINFEIFQEIFNEHSCFYADLVYFLFRVKTDDRNLDMEEAGRSQSRNAGKLQEEEGKWKFESKFKEAPFYDKEKRAQVGDWFRELKDFNKTMTLIKYE